VSVHLDAGGDLPRPQSAAPVAARSAGPTAVVPERVMGFAAPALAAVDPGVLGTMLAAPLPATSPALPAFLSPGRLEPGGLGRPATTVAAKGATVPPLPRRRPKDPAGEPAAAPPEPPQAVAETQPGGAPKSRTAGASRPHFDTSTRSALGGPKPTAPTPGSR
jgi:hypothetical protein